MRRNKNYNNNNNKKKMRLFKDSLYLFKGTGYTWYSFCYFFYKGDNLSDFIFVSLLKMVYSELGWSEKHFDSYLSLKHI